MARVTSNDQTCAPTTSLLESRTSHLCDSRQIDCDVMSVLISSEADVLLANLAYGHDSVTRLRTLVDVIIFFVAVEAGICNSMCTAASSSILNIPKAVIG